MTRSTTLTVCVLGALLLTGCDLLDPARPSPQPDTESFGTLLGVEPDPEREGVWVAGIRIRVPRALGRVDDARPTPDLPGGLLAVVAVTRETIVLVDDLPVAVTDIGPGTEVVAIPVPGTTTAHGDSEVHLEAAWLMDFTTYARWQMPKLELPDERSPVADDPSSINSGGMEAAPVPVGDGSVLYFTARLRHPVSPDGPWIGAARPGLERPAVDGRSHDRVFRTELGPDGWSIPELVVFPGIGDDSHVKATWVGPDELRCLLTVSGPEQEPWVGVSERTSAADAWGAVVALPGTEGGDAFDATVMAGADGATVFASTRSGAGDLLLNDPSRGPAQPLQPEINTGRLEWGARVGPEGELYFVRGDRQLRFSDGATAEVRLAGPHRWILTEAAPTADGAWLFFASPKMRPIELDFDIYAARLADDGSLGPAVPIDDWRPD